MIVFGLCLIAAYALLLAIVLFGWFRIVKPQEKESKTFVSIIVPVRNEEKTIGTTLLSIAQSNYPAHQREIIVVNDHSTDSTESVLNSLDLDIVRVNLTGDEQGKKTALTKGIEIAKGQLIVCTDGDTIVPENWISEHVNSFETGNQLSFGEVGYLKKNLGHEMLETELTALVAVGAATSGFGKPSMINGCNYSFSKEAFETIGGFAGNEQVPTGDDEFLLRKISKTFPGKVEFVKTKVQTEPVQSWDEFINQRRRWASKWKLHNDWTSRLLPGLVFLFYASLIATISYLISVQWMTGLILVAGKFLVDLVFLFNVSKGLTARRFLSIGLLQIIYPFYVVFFGLASNFGSYQWRGRKYRI